VAVGSYHSRDKLSVEHLLRAGQYQQHLHTSEPGWSSLAQTTPTRLSARELWHTQSNTDCMTSSRFRGEVTAASLWYSQREWKLEYKKKVIFIKLTNNIFYSILHSINQPTLICKLTTPNFTLVQVQVWLLPTVD